LDKEIGAKQLRDAVIATITEFLDELENSRVKVEGDTIVTYGYSTTVDTFLKVYIHILLND
jgi:translation initiation factor 2B subunit (eIF-2B alpha/beta/delta family)